MLKFWHDLGTEKWEEPHFSFIIGLHTVKQPAGISLQQFTNAVP
jgi:hypothetical protein